MSYVQVVDFEVGDWSFISCGWRWKPPSLPEIKRERRAAIVTVAWKNSVSGGGTFISAFAWILVARRDWKEVAKIRMAAATRALPSLRLLSPASLCS